MAIRAFTSFPAESKPAESESQEHRGGNETRSKPRKFSNVFSPLTTTVLNPNPFRRGGARGHPSSRDRPTNLPILLTANPTVTVDRGGRTLGGIIAGGGFGITKSGAGQPTLSGANNSPGPTISAGGPLAFTA